MVLWMYSHNPTKNPCNVFQFDFINVFFHFKILNLLEKNEETHSIIYFLSKCNKESFWILILLYWSLNISQNNRGKRWNVKLIVDIMHNGRLICFFLQRKVTDYLSAKKSWNFYLFCERKLSRLKKKFFLISTVFKSNGVNVCGHAFLKSLSSSALKFTLINSNERYKIKFSFILVNTNKLLEKTEFSGQRNVKRW